MNQLASIHVSLNKQTWSLFTDTVFNHIMHKKTTKYKIEFFSNNISSAGLHIPVENNSSGIQDDKMYTSL